VLGSYLVSATRAIERDPWHAAVNVAGLAVALAAGLLIALYVRHELSYESFFADPDRVYRVESDIVAQGRPISHATWAPYFIADALNEDLSEQLTATGLTERNTVAVETNRGVTRRSIHVSDKHLFDVLHLPVAQGDGAAAMTTPGALLLSRRAAAELFGIESAGEAVGQTLRVNGADMHVAAILEDPPANTDRPVDILVSLETPAFGGLSATGLSPNYEIFVRVKDGVRAETIAAALPGVIARHKPLTVPIEIAPSLRPLRETHFVGGASLTISTQNAIAVAALAATAAFLIFIACFSYINLATARSLLRLKEVGLRKIMGGRTGQLAIQFLIESALVALIAFVLAIVAAAAILPVFGALVGRTFALTDLARPGFIASAAGLFAFVAIAAGAYPALELAARKPADLVRAKRSDGGKLLRTGIVSLQFGLTSALMIAATIAFAQLAFLRNMDLGFEKSGLLVIPLTTDQVADGQDRLLRDRLAASPAITGVTWSLAAPGTAYGDLWPLSRPGDPPGSFQTVLDLSVGPSFFDVYGMRAVAGRVFSDDLDVDRMPWDGPADQVGQANVVLTESAIPLLGYRSPEEALGQQLRSALGSGRVFELTVVGVVSDMHFHLGRQERLPMVFLPWVQGDQLPGDVTARIRPGAVAAAIAEAGAIWSELFPDETFAYQLMEDRIARMSADDDRQSQLFAFFAGLALFVACLGLFALASFVAARRAFEVAVRKVMGASTLGVTRLLMWDFAKPVLLANVIAWPLAYAMVTPWLARFPYRIELSPTYFLGVSALSLGVAMATVLVRTWKTARASPALALRTE
jgi:putative ABC transport system permease protein